jgi:YbdK family carboxylate-amine ligase
MSTVEAAGTTLGVEEEYHLVDSVTGEPARRPKLAEAAATGKAGAQIHCEMQTSQLEVATGVCRTLADLRAELVTVRRAAADAATRADAAILAAATHPFARWNDLERTRLPRYESLEQRFGAIVDRQNICGCHVHVCVPDLETALAVMTHARPYVPVLATLASSSPYHEGVDTGFASFRTMCWSMWPTSGPPPAFSSVAAFEREIETLISTGLIDDPSTVYWDIRPSMRYPTLEFRAADMCTEIDDAVLYAGLVRSLVRTLAGRVERGVKPSEASDAAMSAARWRAARYGLRGELCDPATGALVPATVAVRRVFAELEPDLREHGEYAEITELLRALQIRGSSADRQRACAAGGVDLRAVVRFVANRTVRAAVEGRRPPRAAKSTRRVRLPSA